MYQPLVVIHILPATPAPLLVLATGVTMVIVSDGWAFPQASVYLALGLIVIEAATGSEALKRIEVAEGSNSPAFAAALEPLRFPLFAAVIVVLMVLKPGV